MKTYKAISIVSPNGGRIADGIKTIEVRSWKPSIPLMTDFLVVENEKFLREEGQVDENAQIVAVAQIKSVRSFIKEDIEPSCASYWAEGYFSWELCNVRKVTPIPTIAKREFYDIELSKPI